jgi:hypothetical protein
MAKAIAERRVKLKPVRGAEPFAKRLTVRRYKGGPNYSSSSYTPFPEDLSFTPESGDLEGLGRIMKESSDGFKNIISARKTMMRLKTAMAQKKKNGNEAGDVPELSNVFTGIDIAAGRDATNAAEIPISPVDTIASDVPSAIKELLEEAEFEGTF